MLSEAARQIQEWLMVAESEVLLGTEKTVPGDTPVVEFLEEEQGWKCRMHVQEATLVFTNPQVPPLSAANLEGLEAFAELLAKLLRSRRLSAELFALEEQVRGLMDTSLHLLALLSPDGRVLRLSPRDKETQLGEPLWKASWLGEKFRDEVERSIQRARTEAFAFTLEVATDRSTSYELLLSPITDESGQVSYLVAQGRDLSGKHRMREVLLEEREFAKAVMESIEDAILSCDEQGVVTLINAAGSDLFGLRVGDTVVDKSLFYHPTTGDAGRYRPLSLEKSPLGRALAGERVNEQEVACRYSDGSLGYFSASGRRLVDTEGEAFGAVIALHDMTHRRRAEEALSASERQFRALFRSQPNALLSLDSQGKVLRCNPAAEELFGGPQDQLSRCCIQQLLAPGQAVDVHFSGEKELRFCRTDGSEFWGLSRTVVVSDEQGVLGLMWLVSDISAQKSAEAEVASINRKLAVSRDMERSRLGRELHDGAVQNLLATSYRLTDPHLRKEILEVVSQLRDTISDLRPPGLAELGLQAALEAFLHKISRHHSSPAPKITLHCRLSPDLEEALENFVFRVVQEAVRNTFRHALASTVEVRLEEDGDRLSIQVKDDGKGFHPPADVKSLVRQDHYGLAGLAERVELVNGSLEILSEPGRGTCLNITCPIE